ncbi:aldehyde dehydrogenase protein [Rutstroemia sp. NJR-2017a BBW]|nr:aldehyde dehydrogenase protein [Rutstroemia sp. NJR-2017a BBW]
MTSNSNLDRLRASVIEGTTENVRYRQRELERLHSSLCKNKSLLLSSISKDADGASGKSNFEPDAEFWLTINAMETHYKSLDFEKSMVEEYLIAKGSDNKERRVGQGLVIIRPTAHTRFYSIITPIAAAIAAGNCVALELADAMLNVDSVLKDLLPKALDPETFCILSTSIGQPSNMFLVDQTTTNSIPSINQLVSNSSARTIAVLDRAADIDAAAKAIVTARFSFNGTSPYSPDLVIVNDFIKNEFTEACSRYAGKLFRKNSVRPQNNDCIKTARALREAEEKGQISMFGSGSFKIVDVLDSSLVDSISIARPEYVPLRVVYFVFKEPRLTFPSSDLLALYTFSDAATAKFLSQHFNALTSYANHIPSHLLVGPAAPVSPLAPPPRHKYSIEMFSSPRPQYTSSASAKDDVALVDSILAGFYEPAKQQTALQKLDATMGGKQGRVLQPKKIQPMGDQLGFFEQGILLGLGSVLAFAISTVGIGIWAWKRML